MSTGEQQSTSMDDMVILVPVPTDQYDDILEKHGFPADRRDGRGPLIRVTPGRVQEACAKSSIVQLLNGEQAVATVTKTISYSHMPAEMPDLHQWVPIDPGTFTVQEGDLCASLRCPMLPRKRPRTDDDDDYGPVEVLDSSTPINEQQTDDEGDVTDYESLPVYPAQVVDCAVEIIIDELCTEPTDRIPPPAPSVYHLGGSASDDPVVPTCTPDAPLTPMPAWWTSFMERDLYAAYLEMLISLPRITEGMFVQADTLYVYQVPAPTWALNRKTKLDFVVRVKDAGYAGQNGRLRSVTYKFACMHGCERGTCTSCKAYIPCRKHYAFPSACPGGCPWNKYCEHGIRGIKCSRHDTRGTRCYPSH